MQQLQQVQSLSNMLNCVLLSLAVAEQRLCCRELQQRDALIIPHAVPHMTSQN
jgi:hypothetical protein